MGTIDVQEQTKERARILFLICFLSLYGAVFSKSLKTKCPNINIPNIDILIGDIRIPDIYTRIPQSANVLPPATSSGGKYWFARC